MTDSSLPDPRPGRRTALRGDLLDFTATPAWGERDSAAVRYRPDHWLLIDAGRIVGARPAGEGPPPAGFQPIDQRGRLILPGFVDTHVHSPQLDIIASYGAQLLDWLETYTFPAESRYRDRDVAEAGAERFVSALLAHGTTSAVVFPTVHAGSVDALFGAAERRRMRLITGKVLMDRHAPPDLLDDVASGRRDSEALIERWHGRGRNRYAVTVRFAITSTPAQLAMAGELLRSRADLILQTHLAENRDEVAWIAKLFPTARSYLDVYQQAGLLRPGSVFAHGIWLDADDRAALAAAGAQIAHSPSSNLFLGSGLFDWRALRTDGVPVSLATDVGGGSSLSMIRAMADAYRVQALRGERLTAWVALEAATRAGARALGLEHEIGSLDAGCMADLCIWDRAATTLAEHRLSLANDLHEEIFAWLMLADERNLVAAWVAGEPCYRRGASGDPAGG